ncbi:MAG: anti-sigma factor family protein [Rhodopirellula sp. JB044]|uniref:anti-sigma factor family protein n=1 Tax=Rhodopirellula sp. JB044 TaxID=3342844 RepID=UPI00370B719E
MNIAKFEDLLCLYLDDGLSNDSMEEFEQMLLQSAEARKTFLEQTNLHAMLREFFRPMSVVENRFTA